MTFWACTAIGHQNLDSHTCESPASLVAAILQGAFAALSELGTTIVTAFKAKLVGVVPLADPLLAAAALLPVELLPLT